MKSLPLPELTEAQNEILRICFELLMETHTPVPVEAIRTGWPAVDSGLDDELAALAVAGRVQLNDSSEVTGAVGLSLLVTQHQIIIDGFEWHTWCAIDALGILGALQATGIIRSVSPHSGAKIELIFTTGRPTAGDLSSVVFLSGYRPGSAVVDQWCPTVNFFETERAANVWATDHELTGECYGLDPATTLATQSWRERLRPRNGAVIDR